MRRFAIPVAAGVALITIAACSPDAGDFKDDAEGFIEDDDGDVESQLGVALSDASCDDPPSSDVGTTFNCTAVGDNGQTYSFTVEITGDNSYEVGGGEVVSGSVPPGTTGGNAGTGGTGGTTPPTTAGG